METYVETSTQGFVKGATTGIVINKRQNELDTYMAQRERIKKEAESRMEIQVLKEEFRSLKKNVDEKMDELTRSMQEIKNIILGKATT